MKTKLILVEGLPGFGKTTTATIIEEILQKQGVQTKLFLEGNLDHPADYDGCAYFKLHELPDILREHAQQVEDGWVIPYQKLRDRLPDSQLADLYARDIYELPLELNRRLIADRWRSFAAAAAQEDTVYIFECCFLQNPMTVSMIKYGAAYEESLAYVQELEQAILPLQPMLVYVNQQDLESAFRRAVAERPQAWSEGFAQYYTQQGFGQEQGYEGLDGTLAVLEERRARELRILSQLQLASRQLDNSHLNRQAYKEELTGLLQGLC
ncbi:hypothetical protein [Ectobacillus ponti]|uniref:Uncharacterized protein n=1 Tax=Ectobacillus ponti TaxID=2961894 RepID=A0AA41X852_9BACI|nr:hypothetical protein [Ectobacillus ponti]MCP8968048.1 hypothetical protein [Ectobacillus ponti]